MPRRTEKVVCYVVRDGELLVVVHDGHPLEVTGVQVPAGTIRAGESPQEAAAREAAEETGLDDLRVVRTLGTDEYDIRPYRDEIMTRHFVELRTASDALTWQAGEDDPEHGDPQRWTCRWIPLAQAHVLASGQGAMIGRLLCP